jgi:hypothetical protein
MPLALKVVARLEQFLLNLASYNYRLLQDLLSGTAPRQQGSKFALLYKSQLYPPRNNVQRHCDGAKKGPAPKQGLSGAGPPRNQRRLWICGARGSVTMPLLMARRQLT